MTVPHRPKIYHIVHIDRLCSILADQYLWCDATITSLAPSGTNIGMSSIKQRRLNDLTLTNYPDLYVGGCVPFYFCPRSIMLYLLYQSNHSELSYRSGQEPIIHLEADLYDAIDWAENHNTRWAFTLSNAGAYYFEDRASVAQLNELNWEAIQTHRWSGNGVAARVKEGKQAEFLMEKSFPWQLIERIGVQSHAVQQQVLQALAAGGHQSKVEIKTDWYY
ncbi:type II toxin-antitoxin system toxin DNA ADP-ribosyl transferase DarT [Oceanisphaera avium]|uniref:DarT domain-containing protein n=1 Tax=Oceanisphaera avium TaxID=1903694 RepID=A0A1Y0CUL3_9GAMM|nr:hypothetical protein CBP12_01175 [Oceanisphaera avium]